MADYLSVIVLLVAVTYVVFHIRKLLQTIQQATPSDIISSLIIPMLDTENLSYETHPVEHNGATFDIIKTEWDTHPILISSVTLQNGTTGDESRLRTIWQTAIRVTTILDMSPVSTVIYRHPSSATWSKYFPRYFGTWSKVEELSIQQMQQIESFIKENNSIRLRPVAKCNPLLIPASVLEKHDWSNKVLVSMEYYDQKGDVELLKKKIQNLVQLAMRMESV